MKRYVFIMIGSNQVFRAKKCQIFQELKLLMLAILAKNPIAKVFFGGVLPRPNNNEVCKPVITSYNRHLSAAVKRLQKEFTRVFYIPCQVFFQQESEFDVLFEQGLHLNEFWKNEVETGSLGAGRFY